VWQRGIEMRKKKEVEIDPEFGGIHSVGMMLSKV
jgi:hypothetical protein